MFSVRYGCTLILWLAVTVGAGDTNRLHHLKARDDSLFMTAKSVVELSSDKLDSFSPGSEKCPWIVLYYDSDCGHCRSFAPHYAGIADEKSTDSKPFLYGAVNCHTYDAVCRERSIHAFPTVKGFVNGNWVDVEATSEGVRSYFKNNYQFSAATKPRCRALWQYFQEQNKAKLRLAQAERGRQGGDKKVEPFKEHTEFEQADVANAFFSTMWHEVPMRPTEESSTEALVGFLEVVKLAIPQLEPQSLIHYLEKKGSPSDVNEWKEKVEQAGIPIKGTPGDLVWTTCKGSSWQYRGFPCGMWLLFHSILASTPSSQACVALDGIHAYVKEFFLCSECREHFASHTIDFHQGGRTDCYDKANLWLWKVHNEVNKRLGAEQDDNDPLVPKLQHPNSKQCPSCFDKDGEFIQSKVVSYLDDRYRWDVHKLPLTPPHPERPLHNGLASDAGSTHRIEKVSTRMTIFCALLVCGMIIFVMWRSLGAQKPVKQRAEYIAERKRLLKMAGKFS